MITPTRTVATIIENQVRLNPIVIGYGLDAQTFRPPLPPDDGADSRGKLNLPSNVPMLLHVGRLDLDKSVDKVIRAAAPAVRTTETHLFIVGGGCQKESLMRLCREMGIERKVHFHAFSEAIVTLLHSPKRACTMRVNGRMLVSKPDVQNACASHENLYYEMTKQINRQYTTKTMESFHNGIL